MEFFNAKYTNSDWESNLFQDLNFNKRNKANVKGTQKMRYLLNWNDIILVQRFILSTFVPIFGKMMQLEEFHRKFTNSYTFCYYFCEVKQYGFKGFDGFNNAHVSI